MSRATGTAGAGLQWHMLEEALAWAGFPPFPSQCQQVAGTLLQTHACWLWGQGAALKLVQSLPAASSVEGEGGHTSASMEAAEAAATLNNACMSAVCVAPA